MSPVSHGLCYNVVTAITSLEKKETHWRLPYVVSTCDIKQKGGWHMWKTYNGVLVHLVTTALSAANL
jgi:hypothetical protein